jgi:hypothetical protein
MRIDPNGTIGGSPALAVRKMLRYLRGWDQWKVADLEAVAALAPGTGDARKRQRKPSVPAMKFMMK